MLTGLPAVRSGFARTSGAEARVVCVGCVARVNSCPSRSCQVSALILQAENPCLCVHDTRHAEVVWFSCTVPDATPSSAVFGRRHYRDFWWLAFVARTIHSTRCLILSGEMAVAYFKFHAPQGFWPLLNDGEGAVLYCFIFLYLASTGGGPWTLIAGCRNVHQRSS